jgi:hypothetical protein
MIRAATLLWLGVAALVGWGLFHVKHAVLDLERELAAVELETAATREAIRVLEAEWAFLNRPDRLEALSSRLLGMTPADSRHVGSPADLPLRLDLIAEQNDIATPPAVAATASTESAR